MIHRILRMKPRIPNMYPLHVDVRTFQSKSIIIYIWKNCVNIAYEMIHDIIHLYYGHSMKKNTITALQRHERLFFFSLEKVTQGKCIVISKCPSGTTKKSYFFKAPFMEHALHITISCLRMDLSLRTDWQAKWN